MDETIAHIEELSKLSPYIKLYRNFDSKTILKHIGKITGEIDRSELETEEVLQYAIQQK